MTHPTDPPQPIRPNQPTDRTPPTHPADQIRPIHLAEPVSFPTEPASFAIAFDGRRVAAEPGQTVAAALWAAGIRSWRTTREAAAPRGLFCGIGICFDCLVTIDGLPNQRACLIPASPGLTVTTQLGPGR